MSVNFKDRESDAILYWNRESNALFNKLKQNYALTENGGKDHEGTSVDDDGESSFTSPNIPSVNQSRVSEYSGIRKTSMARLNTLSSGETSEVSLFGQKAVRCLQRNLQSISEINGHESIINALLPKSVVTRRHRRDSFDTLSIGTQSGDTDSQKTDSRSSSICELFAPPASNTSSSCSLPPLNCTPPSGNSTPTYSRPRTPTLDSLVMSLPGSSPSTPTSHSRKEQLNSQVFALHGSRHNPPHLLYLSSSPPTSPTSLRIPESPAEPFDSEPESETETVQCTPPKARPPTGSSSSQVGFSRGRMKSDHRKPSIPPPQPPPPTAPAISASKDVICLLQSQLRALSNVNSALEDENKHLKVELAASRRGSRADPESDLEPTQLETPPCAGDSA